MAQTMKIVVLDHQLDRMRECEQAVQQAVREVGLKAEVTMVSEPPYLARLDVWDRLPALEIDGMIWRLKGRLWYQATSKVCELTDQSST